MEGNMWQVEGDMWQRTCDFLKTKIAKHWNKKKQDFIVLVLLSTHAKKVGGIDINWKYGFKKKKIELKISIFTTITKKTLQVQDVCKANISACELVHKSLARQLFF